MLIAVLGLLLASQAATGSVSGQVQDAATGQPIAGAAVTLCRGHGVPKPRCESYSAVTNADGIFAINSLPADTYDADATAAGHLSVQERVSCTVLPGQQTSNVIIQLPPEATISGRVLKADGTPMGGASLEALLQIGKQRFSAAAQTKADGSGAYTLNQLKSGSYLVAVEPQNSAPYFLPGTTDADAAQAVQLSAGQRYGGAEIRLRPTSLHAVAGKVDGLDALPPATSLHVLVYSRGLQIDDAPPRSAQVAQDGRFEIPNVSSGDYTLVLEAPRFGTRQQSDLAIQVLQKEDVSIGDFDLKDVTLSALPLANVTGRIELDDAKPEERAHLQPGLALVEPFRIHEFKKAVVAADGSFSFAACQPARYELRLYSTAGLYVAEVDVNGTAVSSRVLDFSAGNGATLTLRYERGTAALAGTVQGRRTAGVYLIPADWVPDDWREVRWVNTRADGAFSFTNLRPGEYSAIAVDKQVSDPADMRSLAARGTTIEFAPGEQKRMDLKNSD